MLYSYAYLLTPVSALNQPPCVAAGHDVSFSLPAAAALHGSVTDDLFPITAVPLEIAWSKSSGPGGVTFGDASSPETTATFGAEGTNELTL